MSVGRHKCARCMFMSWFTRNVQFHLCNRACTYACIHACTCANHYVQSKCCGMPSRCVNTYAHMHDCKSAYLCMPSTLSYVCRYACMPARAGAFQSERICFYNHRLCMHAHINHCEPKPYTTARACVCKCAILSWLRWCTPKSRYA